MIFHLKVRIFFIIILFNQQERLANIIVRNL